MPKTVFSCHNSFVLFDFANLPIFIQSLISGDTAIAIALALDISSLTFYLVKQPDRIIELFVCVCTIIKLCGKEN